MKRERQISDEMLVKYLLGEVSEAESTEVAQWINENAANKDEYESFKLVWEQSGQLAATSTINTDDAWARFQQRTRQARPATKHIPVTSPYKWLRAAAVLLLLAGGTWVAVNNMTKSQAPLALKIAEQPAVRPAISAPTPMAKPITEKPKALLATASTKASAETVLASHTKEMAAAVTTNKKYLHKVKNYYTRGKLTKTKINGFICNDTPYPFEICITQTLKCRNDKASRISTCDVLEPDQSGRLKYKSYGKIARNCKETIDEIRITKINTGETIVLNDHSTPSTAQNFFDHITGKEKGDVFAGMFHSDNDCGLTFDSNFGNLTLQ